MLVLSRKEGQRILIGDNIAVTVVKINHGGVRLGIDAPADMPVVREELAKKMDSQGQQPPSSISDRVASR